jgi:NADH dehydrogenase
VLTTFPESLRTFALRALADLGVEVRTGTLVTSIEPGVVRAGSTVIEADTVLWAAGVAASPLGRTLGVPVDRVGRVLVEPDLTVPGHPELYVVGDLAGFTHQGGRQLPGVAHVAGPGGQPLPGVAQVAMQQAGHVARIIREQVPAGSRRAFRYVDLGSLATIGRAKAVADFGWMRFKGYFAWLLWLFVHIMKLTGFRNRVVVLVQWAWAYVSYQRSIRLITGDDRSAEAALPPRSPTGSGRREHHDAARSDLPAEARPPEVAAAARRPDHGAEAGSNSGEDPAKSLTAQSRHERGTGATAEEATSSRGSSGS